MREVDLKFNIDIFNTCAMLRTIQSFYRDGAHSFLVNFFVQKKISSKSSKFSFLWTEIALKRSRCYVCKNCFAIQNHLVVHILFCFTKYLSKILPASYNFLLGSWVVSTSWAQARKYPWQFRFGSKKWWLCCRIECTHPVPAHKLFYFLDCTHNGFKVSVK